MNEPKRTGQRSLLAYAGLGVEVSGLLIGGAEIGYFLDKWLDTSPIIILVMMILATVAIIVRVIKIAGWMEQQDE